MAKSKQRYGIYVVRYPSIGYGSAAKIEYGAQLPQML
jgi:hypothetical protein